MARRCMIIGLSGGVGSGKSEVAAAFAEAGAWIIDADRIAREELDSQPVRLRLREWWGGGIFRSDGAVDRRALADRVFADPPAKQRLEGLVHPRVHARREAMRAEAASRAAAEGAARLVIEDCPLLWEAGIARTCDRIVFVHAPRADRIERVRLSRGWDGEELTRREKSQRSLDRKAADSDYVLVNTGERSACREQVRHLITRILPPE